MNNVLEASTAERQPLTLDEAEDAILARWEDPQDEASDSETEAALEVEEETNDQPEFDEEDTYEEVDLEEEDTDPEDTDDEQQEEDGDEAEEAEALADDAEVEILVDGETHRASVADLKRLYGQEASLTRKSQAVSQQRKQAEDAMQRSDALLQAMLSRAEERFKPYSEVDMLLASKTMDAEDFAALRKEAQAASEDVRFLREEADNFYGELRKQHEAAQKQAATEAVRVLQDAIPDWSNETYADIRSYAVAQGLPEDQVNIIVDPSVIQIINKARLFDQGKRVATEKKKKAATQKKVLRSKKSPPNATARRKADIDKQRAALRNNRGTDLEDIASVLMSRWET
jgi:hypothetical protein